jgi:hypothetical protein
MEERNSSRTDLIRSNEMSYGGMSEKSYGVRKRSPEPEDDLGVALEMLHSRGFAVVANAFHGTHRRA